MQCRLYVTAAVIVRLQISAAPLPYYSGQMGFKVCIFGGTKINFCGTNINFSATTSNYKLKKIFLVPKELF